MALETKSIISDWKESEAIKQAFKMIKMRGRTKTVSRTTRESYSTWMPRYMDFSKLNPDELIAEGKKDPELSEERISNFYSHVIENQPYSQKVSVNSCITGIYGTLRGFYSKNKVNTQGWVQPHKEVSQVDTIDSEYPLFVKDPKTNKLDLNRELLGTFFKHLNSRDEVIAYCLMSSGLDISDILGLRIEDIIGQESQSRIFVTINRGKTGEIAKTFFSKEATKKLRHYILNSRKEAKDNEHIFVNTLQNKRDLFFKKHGRKPTIDDRLESVSVCVTGIDENFRRVQSLKLGLKVRHAKQSPLRPKRLRKLFKSGCTRAGVSEDMVRVFMGQKGAISKVYLGKSREELESYYEIAEPYLTLSVISLDEEKEILMRENQELKLRLERIEKALFNSKFS